MAILTCCFQAFLEGMELRGWLVVRKRWFNCCVNGILTFGVKSTEVYDGRELHRSVLDILTSAEIVQPLSWRIL